MKTLLTNISLTCFYIFIFGCKKDIDPDVKLVSAKGYSLYWHHDLSSTEGRGLLFAFDAKEALNDACKCVLNYSYRYLDAERNSHLNETSREPENHSISILFNTKGIDFKSIFRTAANRYNLSENKLTVGIMSSNGDDGNMNPCDGIHVVCAK